MRESTRALRKFAEAIEDCMFALRSEDGTESPAMIDAEKLIEKLMSMAREAEDN